MTHRHQFDGVGVQGSLIARTGLEQVVLQGQVRRQFRGGHDIDIGDDLIAGTVVTDTDDTSVLHRFTCEVAHTLTCSHTR